MSHAHRLHERCACTKGHAAHAEGRPFAFPHTSRKFERARPFHVEHLALDLDLQVLERRVRGSATLTVRRVDPDADTIVLDAIAFEISAVHVGKATGHYAYDGREIHVTIPRTVERVDVRVEYTATPRRGLYFLEPDESYPSRPRQVWSQCQEEDARHFIPCHDKPHVKMTSEVALRVPEGWFALSNGDLVSKKTTAGEKAFFHYRLDQPHPSYLMTLVAGEFVELRAQAGNVPLAYYVPKGLEADGARSFGRTPAMVQHFGEITGVPYPWSRYSQVVVSDFIFGGMENTTATTMYEYVVYDERASIDVTSDDLVAHELAHQWFGDYVTCRDWPEAWLNEGFATYMEHVFREKHLGKDEYFYGVKADLDAYIGEARGRYRRPIVCREYDAPLDLFDRHLYEKGGLVLHLLRTELGDRLFWAGIKLYLTRHAHGLVETRDLMRALEDASGRTLGRFFEQWVYQPGHPELEVEVRWELGILTVSVKQQQAVTDGVAAVFELPLEIDVHGEGKSARQLLTLGEGGVAGGRAETFAIPCTKRPAFVVVDPRGRILGDVRVKVPNDLLRAQLKDAPDARGRWLAARALARADDDVSLRALGDALASESEFWGVRVEAADALAQLRVRASYEILAASLGVKHPKVRRAVAGAVGRWKTPAAALALQERAKKDPSYLVEAESARSLGKTGQTAGFETLIDLLERDSWADVVRVGALEGLGASRDERAVPHLIARTRYGHAPRTRRAAILALPKLAQDKRVREVLEDLLDDADPMLRLDVARALADLGDAKSVGALRARIEVENDARAKRRMREAVRDLGHDGKRGGQVSKEELEKLEGEHSELKARLAALEARVTGDTRASSSKGLADAPGARSGARATKGTGSKKGEPSSSRASAKPRKKATRR
jgi:aminopeptidase N